MNLENRIDKLFGLGAAILSSQILFLYALVSAPEPVPLDLPYKIAVIMSAISIPACVVFLARLLRKEDTRIWVLACVAALSAAATIVAIIWHFVGPWANVFPIVFVALVTVEHKLPLEENNPALDLARWNKVRLMLRELAERKKRA